MKEFTETLAGNTSQSVETQNPVSLAQPTRLRSKFSLLLAAAMGATVGGLSCASHHDAMQAVQGEVGARSVVAPAASNKSIVKTSSAVDTTAASSDIDKEQSLESIKKESHKPISSLDIGKKYEYLYKVDGMRVFTNTIQKKYFLWAFDWVKKLIGRDHKLPSVVNVDRTARYWAVGVMPVGVAMAELGNPDFNFDEFQNPAWDPGTPYDIRSCDKPWLPRQPRCLNMSYVERSCDKVSIAEMEDLPHALLHMALCRDTDNFEKWPEALNEFVASAADQSNTLWRINDRSGDFSKLEEPWIQQTADPIPASERFLVPVHNAIYSKIMHELLEEEPQIVQDIVRAALQEDKNGALNFESGRLAEFLRGFGIEHPVFEPGKPGEYTGIYGNKRINHISRGIIIVRYTRTEGPDSKVIPWKGSVTWQAKDKSGNVYGPFTNYGFVGEMSTISDISYIRELAEVTVAFGDGKVETKIF